MVQIYTEPTGEGRALLAAARPDHDRALHEAVEAARATPELADLVDAVPGLA